MRFSLSATIRRKLRESYTMDVYTHRPVEMKLRSIEHVLPVSFVKDRLPQIDPLHLFITDSRVNSFRKNYRFGGIPDPDALYEWECFTENYRDHKRRLFCPGKGHRLVAHTMWKMVHKYPHLQQEEDQFFESWEIWQEWLKRPWTPIEKWMWSKAKDFQHR